MTERRIAWVDVETTGLDPRESELLALGCIITDMKLRELSRAEWVLSCSEQALASMPPKVQEMHTTSGLLFRVRASSLTVVTVRYHFAAFLDRWALEQPILAGASVHFDRGFLEHHLGLRERFHHRHLDVSVLRVVAELYAPAEAQARTSKRRPAHLPLPDLEATFTDFAAWRNLLFQPAYWGMP